MAKGKKTIKLRRLTVFAVILAVFVICGLLLGRSYKLRAEAEDYRTQLVQLQEEKKEIKNKKKELREYRKYMSSDKYVEDTARQKLGLVYPGEIVFEPEDSGE